MHIKALFKKILLLFILLTGIFYYFIEKDRAKSDTVKKSPTAQECSTSGIATAQTSFNGNKNVGFESLSQTTPLQKLTLQGTLPPRLKGMVIATGPGQFELGPTNAAYWFNGLALLHGFYFDGESISYRNGFLDSVYYQRCMKNGRFDSSMSTEKPKGFFSRLASAALGAPEPYDNGNLAIAVINDKIVALTETILGVQIDPVTLKTVQPFNLNDHLEGHLTTINFLYDSYTNTHYNYLINFGTTSAYVVYKIGADSTPEQITSISVKTPSYMRSMAMTKNYIILIEIPFIVNPMDLLLGAGAFIEKVQWKPELGTKFTIIDKKSGALVNTLHSPTPFLVFNTINAFEKNDEITIDFIAYNNADIIPYTKVEALHSTDSHEFEPSYYTRAKLNLTSASVTDKQLCMTTLSCPTFNKKFSMEPYGFVYGVSASERYKFPHKLVKIDTQTGATLKWQEEGCYANEPIFVPTPEAHKEDDGIILSLIFDSIVRRSFLLILNATTFQEVVRAYLPTPVPLGIAGTFIPNPSQKAPGA